MPEQTNKVDNGPARDDNGLWLGLRHPLASLLAALRFLTILPISWHSERDGQFFQASLCWFPVIGLLIGFGTGALSTLLAGVLPSQLVAFLAILILAGISGCLHLDGLADSGDGLLSARSKEKSLVIMRDSRIGAMGVIVLIIVLLGKYAALSSLSTLSMAQAVFLMPLAGRSGILLSMALLPYARSGEGLGRLFYSRDSRWVAGIALLVCLLAAASFSWQVACLQLAAITVTVGLFSFWCYQKIGGATGDTLGAACELTELATALVLTLKL